MDSATEVSAKRYRFTGKERDEESGLYYHGARYYAPWLARWTAPDPAGMVDGVNLYQYVRGNPVRLVDPDGRESGDPVLAGYEDDVASEIHWAQIDDEGEITEISATSISFREGEDLEGEYYGPEDSSNEEPSFRERHSGPAFWLRDASEVVERQFFRFGNWNRNLTEDRASFYADRVVGSDTIRGQVGYGVGLAAVSVWAVVSPQSGDQAMAEVATAPLAGGRRVGSAVSDIGSSLAARVRRMHVDESGAVRIFRDSPSTQAQRQKRSHERHTENLNVADSLNEARENAAYFADLEGDLVPFLADAGPHSGRVYTGMATRDGHRGWRLDWDSTKGMHVNWWNMTADPSHRSEWYYGSVTIEGATYDDYLSVLEHFPRR